MRPIAAAPFLLACVLQAQGNLPAYSPNPDLKGRVAMMGSDSMEPLIALLESEFRKVQPAVSLDLQYLGSGVAISALTEGRVSLIFSSRELTAEEIAAATTRNGGAPVRLPLAIDAVAIYVNPGCPLRQITFEELDALFSTTRKGGYPSDILTWGDLGAKGEWAKRPVKLLNQPEKSGTRAFFQAQVLKGGMFKPGLAQAADAWAAQEAPLSDAAVLSYGTASTALRGVRMLAVAPTGSKTGVDPTPEAFAKGNYPLSRFLYVYAAKRAMDAPSRAWLSFLFSREGQQAVASYGTTPIPEDLARVNLNRIR